MIAKSATWILAVLIAAFALHHPSATAAPPAQGHLVSAQWVAEALRTGDVVLLDASPGSLYKAKHIPGAVHVDLFSFVAGNMDTPAQMQKRLQAWGVSPRQKIIVYDQGAAIMAARIFFDLYYLGLPLENLFLLDGGLHQWELAGGPTTDQVPQPTPSGQWPIPPVRESARARLPEFLAATGDISKNAIVEALDASYHFGETKFFSRAGHVPHAIMLPPGDFFNADKTFKSPAELTRMMSHLGIDRSQTVYSHCGGGWAASVPFFALKFILDFPQVKLFSESQLGWLQDPRELAFWTYDAPYLQRDMHWLNGWNSRMLRAYGVSQLGVIDVRSGESYVRGHIPYALSFPVSEMAALADDPTALARRLRDAGVRADQEAVIVSDGGLTKSAALAFVFLQHAGQQRVSVLMDSMDDWALQGFPTSNGSQPAGPESARQDRPAVSAAQPVAHKPASYPAIYLASAHGAAGLSAPGPVIELPYQLLLNEKGAPKPAQEVWRILTKAGVSRYAEIICFAPDPGAAAINYFILKLMGFPDVKVRLK